MNNSSPKFRIGNGYHIHRLVEDRDFIIGGVKLHHPENLGLDGRSDADVLSHLIMDALLGALLLGDIVKNLPPSDEKWKNANFKKISIKGKMFASIRIVYKFGKLFGFGKILGRTYSHFVELVNRTQEFKWFYKKFAGHLIVRGFR